MAGQSCIYVQLEFICWLISLMNQALLVAGWGYSGNILNASCFLEIALAVLALKLMLWFCLKKAFRTVGGFISLFIRS